jgi:hypothetical protein
VRVYVKTVLIIICLGLAACTTPATSNPSRTATEEMLISTAADRAAAKLSLTVPQNTPVFIDASNFEGTDSKYAIGAIRSSLLRQGARLVGDKKDADMIIEIRAGALSTDRKETLVGIPSFNVPIPLTSSPLTFPEIAIYKEDDQIGVAKFASASYDAKSGAYAGSQDPQYGFAHNKMQTVMIFFSWGSNDSLPPEADGGHIPGFDR